MKVNQREFEALQVLMEHISEEVANVGDVVFPELMRWNNKHFDAEVLHMPVVVHEIMSLEAPPWYLQIIPDHYRFKVRAT